MIPIIMPQVGQDIPKATVVQWLKKEGDPVRQGEVIAVVESEKAAFELEAEASGVLLKIAHREGEEVEILTPIGYIGQPGEKLEETPSPAKAAALPVAAPISPVEQTSSEGPLASPSARRLAKEKGIDLSTVKGTGPGGRIVEKDILAAIPAVSAETEPDTVIPFSKVRKAIARRLTLSKQTIPHFYISVDVDMTKAVEWRARFNAGGGAHITITDLAIQAAALALRNHPRLNAHVGDDRLLLKKNINIGVAVSVEDGLLVPVIADADEKSLAEISEASRKQAEAAHRGMLISGPVGTFTITSLGMYGVKEFIPIINPPECAILAVGAVEPRVVPLPEGTSVRKIMTLTLACDHRAVDGTEAAALLNDIKANLEKISV